MYFLCISSRAKIGKHPVNPERALSPIELEYTVACPYHVGMVVVQSLIVPYAKGIIKNLRGSSNKKESDP